MKKEWHMTEFNTYAYGAEGEAKKEHYEELARLGAVVTEALDAAMAYAKAHGLEFYFSPEYGMGGTFSGKEIGWSPSSGSC
jgi:hypothetical protein